MDRKNIFIIVLIFLSWINICAQESMNSDEIMFSVSIVGAVENPGVYQVPPITKLSEIVKLANIIETDLEKIPTDEETIESIDALSDKFLEEEQDISEIASWRNIRLQRQDTERKCDLLKFLILGEKKQNPYVQDGDVIVVPAKTGMVSIFGSVNKSGEYEFVEGDRISDIIELAMGLSHNAFLEEGEIVRFQNDKQNTKLISFQPSKVLNEKGSEEDLLLQVDDRIFIRPKPEYRPQHFIRINGEINFPGRFAIEEDVTTLYQILQKAGGPTDKADLNYAILQRKKEEDVIDPEFERLKQMNVQEMSVMEYEYLKTQLRQMQGKVSVNFTKLWRNQDLSFDIKLKNGDQIYIPEKISTVSVSGQIKEPGLLTYVPGKSYKYYIEQAGGYSWNARKGKIRVIRANTGEWLKPDEDTLIEPGDMIFIPENPEINYWELTKDIVRIASDVATIVVIINNVLK